MFVRWALVVALAGCSRPRAVTSPRPVPTATIGLGDCGIPERDGVMSASPRIDRADRDLDGDGQAEAIVVDRGRCDAHGNCYWNVFSSAHAGSSAQGECVRYLGTFAGAALELLASKGDDNMRGVRAYWHQPSGRTLVQPYRFARGGYSLDAAEILECRKSGGDRLECADTSRPPDNQ